MPRDPNTMWRPTNGDPKSRQLFCYAALFALVLGSTPVSLASAGQVASGDTEESAAQEGIDPDEESSEAEDSGTQVWTEQIVVTANRTDRRAKDIPLHTTVVPEQEILIAPESGISDIVRQIPSLNLHGDQSSMVAIPRDQSLNFRGVSGSNVSHGLLLVDGVPLLDPYNASAAWTKVASPKPGTSFSCSRLRKGPCDKRCSQTRRAVN